jgi:hypothetical protein
VVHPWIILAAGDELEVSDAEDSWKKSRMVPSTTIDVMFGDGIIVSLTSNSSLR